MRVTVLALAGALASTGFVAPRALEAQSVTDEIRSRVETARAAAGEEHAY